MTTVTTYTGIGLFEGCPDLNTCVIANTGYAAGSKVLASVDLTAGTTYYLQVDTWPSPACIPSFDLTIEDATPVYVPVTVFPYPNGFESGSIPAEIFPVIASNSTIAVNTDAAGTGTYGLHQSGIHTPDSRPIPMETMLSFTTLPMWLNHKFRRCLQGRADC